MSQRGHIVKPHGKLKSWGIIYRDLDGVQHWEGKFQRKADAQRRLIEVLEAINKGTYTRPSASTFDSFATGWLEARRRLRGSTESAYASLLSRQLIPRLGSTKVSDLRFKHIDALVSGMIEDELSPKTIRNAVTLLRSMLVGETGASAKSQGILHIDPTRGLELPPLEHRVLTPLDPESAWRLIGAARELDKIGNNWIKLEQISYLGAFTGVRRNELLGLRFCDVLWFDNEVHIQHAISKAKATDGAHKWQWVLGPPKSKRSVRRISVPESVMKLLAELKPGRKDAEFVFTISARDAEIGLAGVSERGRSWGSRDAQGKTVAPSAGTSGDITGRQPQAGSNPARQHQVQMGKDGDRWGFIDPDYFDEYIWKRIAVKAGLPNVRFHDLRHFFASQLIAQGESLLYVSRQMGHSSIKVTGDVYGHLFKGSGAAASAKFEQAMGKARQPKEEKAEREVQQ